MQLFRYPEIFIWMIITIGFVMLVLYFGNKRKEKIISYLFNKTAWNRLISKDIIKMTKLKVILLLSSIIFLFIALSAPQWGIELSPSSSMLANTVIAVDVSSSMKARDVKPSRIENVKKILSMLVDNLPNHRIAIVTFTSEAYIQCPLTLDTNAIKFFVSRLETDILPFYGTKVSKAVLTASELMEKYPGEKGLIILTDGEDHKPEKIKPAINVAKQNGIKIFTVGIGSPDGALIPEKIINGKVKEYKKDKDGNTILSKLNEEFLIQLASETGGAYIRNDFAEKTAEFLITELKNIDRSLHESKARAGYKNRYQIPLLISFLFLLLAIILPNKKIFLIFLFLGFYNISYAEQGDRSLIKGNNYYEKEQYGQAINEYKQAYDKQDNGKDKSLFNIGNALYKLKEYDKALALYEQVIEQDSELVQKTYFNQGNASYYDNNTEGAILSYKEAILLDNNDEKTIHNLQFIQQEKEQQKDDKKDDEKQDNKDKQPNQDNQDNKDNDGDSDDEISQEDVDRIMQMAKQSEKNASKQQQQQGSSPPKADEQDKDW